MKKRYLGAICEGGGTYGIVFRDFPGCVSAGDSIDDVLAMGREALQGHVELMVDEGEMVPEPTEHDLAAVDEWIGDVADDERWIGLYPIEIDVPAAPGERFKRTG